MAIFGAGSNWDNIEKKDEFFKNENFEIGWGDETAMDLYVAASLVKVGDIIYLKANQPGSRVIRVKGIGVVRESFIESFFAKAETPDIKVKWVVKEEFYIEIEEEVGRLTNIRAATFYEEHLPDVQKQIVNKLLEG